MAWVVNLLGWDAKMVRANGIRTLFRQLAERTSHAVGSSWAFSIAVLTIVVWGATGSYFRFSDTWQLFINTGTTIVTFLMVFLIQNTQNRDATIVAEAVVREELGTF